MIASTRVSVGSDSLIVINDLRRRALAKPVLLWQYRAIINGEDCRPDLCSHIGMNGRVVTLRAAYTTFQADPEGLGLPIGCILRLVVRSDAGSVTPAEADWIRERFFTRDEDVRPVHQAGFRLFICHNPVGAYRPRQESTVVAIGGAR